MTKQIKELIIVAVLIVVLVLVVTANLKKKATKRPAAVSKSAVESAGKSAAALPIQVAPADDEKLSAQKERANLRWGRDIFVAPTDKEYQRADLKLKGISFGADKKGFAFINNEIVKVGDKVGDYEVLTIEKDKVLVGKGSQTFYLTLPSE